MEQIFLFIAPVLEVATFWLIYGYLSRLAKFDPDPGKYPPLEELEKRWGKFNLRASVALLPAGGGIIYLAWLALDFLQKQLLPDRTDVIYAETADTALLFLIAFFLGIFMTMPLMLGVLRLLLGDRLEEFIYFDNLKSGTNWHKILRIGAYTIVPLLLILAFMLCNSYTYFYRDRVQHNGMLSWGETVYENRDIESFHYDYYKDGSGNVKISWAMSFRDNITTGGTFFPGTPAQKRFFAHIEKISQEAGFEITEKKQGAPDSKKQ